MRVTEGNTYLRQRKALVGEFRGLFNDVFVDGFEPHRGLHSGKGGQRMLEGVPIL